MNKILLLLAVLLLGVAILPACSKDDDKKPLIVACEASSSPYCYYLGSQAKSPVAGIDIDIIKEIGKELGRPVQYKILPFQQVFSFVAMGKADIGAAGITITQERGERVLFSTVYDVSSQVIVVPKNSAITDETALKNARVAAQEGTSDLTFLREHIQPRSVLPFLTQEEVNHALSDRRADAAIMDQMQAELLVKSTGDTFRINPKPLSKEQYGLIFNKSNTALAEVANAVIDKFKLSGELQKSREKHLNALVTFPGYGAKTQMEGVKPFVVCVEASFAPFVFTENNRLIGVDIEMAEAIAAELKRPLQIRLVPFSEIIPLVMNGAADMGATGISITPERAQSVLFSNSYEDSTRRILVKAGSTISDLEDLEHKVVGAKKGTTNEAYALNELHAKTVHYDNATEGIIGLLNHEIDAYIDDETEADLAVGKYIDRIEMLNVSIPAEEYGFVFRHGNTEVKNAADKVIAAKRANGDLQALFRKYISIYKTIDANGI
ncbi:MAG: amino acid ABC transporter substrate-binding protein [Lentisphaeria bacterium]|nr:amino acid ABC transporter substrate-binding protein [Lentisphaeria bacterium]